MVPTALRTFLLTKTAVTDGLAVYQFTTGLDTPSIHASRVMPKDAKYPSIIIRQVGVGEEFECRDHKGATVLCDVRLFGDRETKDGDLRDTAEQIWLNLDRADLRDILTLQGYAVWGCQAGYPQIVEDEDGFPGYLVQARVKMLYTG